MDGHPRQNPAYRPATEKALETGLFLWLPIRRRLVRLAPWRARRRSPWNRSARSPGELGKAGCRIGWQCKWFESAKLTTSRRTQVGDSFKKAKAAFPDMTRWILWTRDALSSVDAKWVGAIDSSVTVESWHTANVEGLMAGDAYIPSPIVLRRPRTDEHLVPAPV